MKYFRSKLKDGDNVVYSLDGEQSKVKLYLAGANKYRYAPMAEMLMTVAETVEIDEAEAVRLGYVLPEPPVWTAYTGNVTLDVQYMSSDCDISVNALGRKFLEENPGFVITNKYPSPLHVFLISRGEDWYGLVHYENVPTVVLSK